MQLGSSGRSFGATSFVLTIILKSYPPYAVCFPAHSPSFNQRETVLNGHNIVGRQQSFSAESRGYLLKTIKILTK
ncbi:hypothetical protein BDR26DRAFT_857755 [Obelidium mucronatum]|nr:hypothetical protein BDR26DRAFT_857755 [Obelidium mucronatum]